MYWPIYGRVSPWREMERLRSEFDRVFSDLGGARRATEVPAVNVWVGEDSAVVTAELPGIDPEELDVSVKENTLTLRCTRHEEPLKEGETYIRQERTHGQFTRTFTLPFRVEPDKVKATYAKGVLKLDLPRADNDKARQITVAAG